MAANTDQIRADMMEYMEQAETMIQYADKLWAIRFAGKLLTAKAQNSPLWQQIKARERELFGTAAADDSGP